MGSKTGGLRVQEIECLYSAIDMGSVQEHLPVSVDCICVRFLEDL